MPIKNDDVVWVEEPEMGFWEATFLPAIAQGLRTTIAHIVKQDVVTQQFPEVKPQLPQNYRGVHRLNRDDQGRVKCVACMLCATACPANCIEIVGGQAPWPDRDKFPQSFQIDELKCIYCGMCEEACPVDAIELTNIFDITGYSREQMTFDREKLLSVYDETLNSGIDPVRTQRGALGPASQLKVALPLPNPVTQKAEESTGAEYGTPAGTPTTAHGGH